MGQTQTLKDPRRAMHRIIRITATIEATQALAWPHFAGSTLRGAWGRALRKAACVTGQPQCTGCPLRNSCAYGVVFDPAPAAQPLHPSFRDGLPRYVMQPPPLGARRLAPGQRQSFSLLLLPGTQAHHHLIQHILRSAVETQLMQAGLFKLVDTQVSDTSCTAGQTSADAPQNHQAGTDRAATTTLRWQTPLRLQHQGKPIFKPSLLDPRKLVQALLRRQMQWCQLTAQTLPDPQQHTQAAGVCTLDTRKMQWHDMQRHSGTQNDKLPLGGLIGSALLTGPAHALQTLQPLLQMGEQLQIGKETVMGLGRYQLSALQPG